MRKRTAMRRGFIGYRSYNFRDKDSAIDRVRSAIQVIAAARGVKFSTVCRRIAEEEGMSQTTLYNWFSGPTAMPRHAALQAVARNLGKEFRLMDTGARVVSLADARRKRRAA